MLIFNGYISVDANGTQQVVCYATSENDSKMVDIWSMVNYLYYSPCHLICMVRWLCKPDN